MRPGEREARMGHIGRDVIQFRRRCLRNRFRTLYLRHRPTEIKGSHLLEIPFGEASAETFGKIVRQTLEYPFSIGSAYGSPLLMLNDSKAAEPVCGRHD